MVLLAYFFVSNIVRFGFENEAVTTCCSFKTFLLSLREDDNNLFRLISSRGASVRSETALRVWKRGPKVDSEFK
jgi:hypothetical protein